MKKKIIITVVIILFFAFALLLSSMNIYLGSNSRFFVSAFDYNESYWYSSKYNIEAKVCNDDEYIYMTLTNKNSGDTYILLSLDDYHVELFEEDSLDECLKSEPLLFTVIENKKIFGKIYKFEIKNLPINSNNTNGSNKDVVFIRK